MSRLLFFIFLFFLSFLSFSQKNGSGQLDDAYSWRKAKPVFTPIPVKATDIRDKSAVQKNIEEVLKGQLSNLQSKNVTLKLLSCIESPGGVHLLFEQLFNGIPVYNSQVKVNMDKKSVIRSIFDNSFDTGGWSESEIEIQKNGVLSQQVQPFFNQRNFPSAAEYKDEAVIFVDLAANKPVVAHRVHVIDKRSALNRELIINPAGHFLIENDLNSYFSAADSTVKALVFMPDPLTSAGVLYGAPYEDADDADVLELNAEIKLVDITAKFQNDTFFLESNFVKISDFDAPSIPPVISLSPDFFYTRSQDGFEDVNVFYHINFFQQYVQSLGFTNLMNSQIAADAHAVSGLDNSLFSPSQGGMLYFGEGGIDDAEDADVIIHEYGHALSYSAAPGTNSGFERKALDEAVGDYLASSYSRSINDFNWEKVYSWDGNNAAIGWYGRNVASSRHYPEHLSSNYYGASEIFSSVMMEIWADLGATTADKLLLQAAYSFAANMSLADAARLVVDADTLLFGGANFPALYKYFVLRGLMDSFMCDTSMSQNFKADAGSDTGIYCGQGIILGGNPAVSGGLTPYEVRWYPSTGLDCDNCEKPYASQLLASATYLFTALDANGCSKTDTITVNILPSLSLSLGTDTMICMDDRYELAHALNLSGGTSPYSYLWSPPDDLSCNDCEYPVLNGQMGRIYTLQVTDASGCAVTDNIFVDVAECVKKVFIYNTENFTGKGEPVFIRPPTFSKEVAVRVYDLYGRLVYQYFYYSDQVLPLSLDFLSRGIYFVKVNTERDIEVEKILKIK